MLKRLLAIIGCMVLVLSTAALTTACKRYGYGLEYELSEDGKHYIVVGFGDFSGTDLIIPKRYKGKKVREIGDCAFRQSNLERVVIPNSIEKIGRAAFAYCINLESVTLSKRLSIIKESAFEGCEALMSITIPKSVKTIANLAFCCCYGLTQITIPEGVEVIGSDVFHSCRNLKKIEISSTVTSIADSPFLFTGLININVSENNSFYKSMDGNLYTKDGATLIRYAIAKKDTVFKVPEGVKNIGAYAFAGCKNLTHVTISNGVENIKSFAFDECENLGSISMSDSLKSIGKYAFAECSKLTSIRIPESVKIIEPRAFWGCDKLSNISVEQTSGWVCKDIYSGVEYGIIYAPTADEMQNQGTLIKYLTDKYSSHSWCRED